MSYPAQLGPGSFIGTTDLLQTDDKDQLLVKLRQVVNDIALVINTKDSAFYVQEEFVNGQVWFPPSSTTGGKTATQRQVFRRVVNFGSLPNTATKSVAHGITTNASFTFTRIYGSATDPGASSVTSAIPIPYAHPTDANNIALDVDATNVIITTGSDRTAYTTSYVVLEYIKD